MDSRKNSDGTDRADGGSRIDALIGEIASACELFHTADGKAYATYGVDGHLETWPVNSKKFRSWIQQRQFRTRGKSLSRASMDQIVQSLEAQAIYGGAEEEVFFRVAERAGTLYLDSGNAAWDVYRIDGTGDWQVISNSPVRFVRSETMRAYPNPCKGGIIDELRPFINVESDDDFRLLIGWAVGALLSDIQYPVLHLIGGQGSAKTSVTRILKRLVDPEKVNVLGFPKSTHDLAVAAQHRRCLAFDNLSDLSGDFSDALCRLSTGGGYANRALYTDDEQIVLEAKRPVILNGITSVIGKGDLQERAIVISLKRIDPRSRRPESDIEADLERVLPRVFGALLDAVSAIVRNRQGVNVCNSPRLADFIKNVTAAEEALGWEPGSFAAAYRRNQHAANKGILEDSELGRLIVALVGGVGSFSGTVTELGNVLRRIPNAPAALRSRTESQLGRELRRLEPLLETVGIRVYWTRLNDRARTRQVVIERQPSVPSVASAEERAVMMALGFQSESYPDERDEPPNECAS